jgi:maleate cis-trans isomerase
LTCTHGGAGIGLIKPTHRGKLFAFWYKNAPDGVEIVPSFIGFKSGTRETFEKAFDRGLELADELKQAKCNVLAMSGTPPFLLKGLDFEREFGAEMSRRTGLPVVTPMEPHAIALTAMGARKVAVATYYKEELNQAIVDYFARFGIESVVIPGLDFTGESEGLYSTPLLALDDVSWMDTYRHCRQGLERSGASVDAIYINGGGWDVPPAIEPLERDLKMKVVWAIAAEMWLTYHKLGVSNPRQGLGRLLSGEFEPE